jgi:hypothetical protein
VLRYPVGLCGDTAIRQGVADWLVGHPHAPTTAEADALLDDGFSTVATTLRRALPAVDPFGADPWFDDPCRHAGEGWRAQEALAAALLWCRCRPRRSSRGAAPLDGDRR